MNETPGVSGFSPLTKVASALWPVPLMASCLRLVEKIGGSRYCNLGAMNEKMQQQLGGGNDHTGIKLKDKSTNTSALGVGPCNGAGGEGVKRTH